MPIFRPDEFLQPKDIQELLSILRNRGKHARIIAGGTGFYELAKRGYIPEVKSVVSIMGMGFDIVNYDSCPISIGATVLLQQLLMTGIGDRPGLEALGDALREIRPQQIRNMATVGGEVCLAVPLVDLPIALLALDSKLRIISSEGEKDVPLEGFYVDTFLTKLAYGEIVKEVRIPQPPARSSSAFVKLGRTAYDFNLVNVAVSISLESNGTISFIRIFVGGIARIPLRATELESKLLGKSPDLSLIYDLAKGVFTTVDPFPSIHGSKEYKKMIIPIVIRDCIKKALSRQIKSG